tara:strand:- start:97 stop:291 length:195 start_codon:yes stop_codon:yes gene_type:complete
MNQKVPDMWANYNKENIMDIVLKVRISNVWKPPANIKCQTFGPEWNRKSNLGWIGRIDAGGLDE